LSLEIVKKYNETLFSDLMQKNVEMDLDNSKRNMLVLPLKLISNHVYEIDYY
jgi:hypothetical protein